MSTQTETKTLVAITSPHFAKGIMRGHAWFFHGEIELSIIEPQRIISFTR